MTRAILALVLLVACAPASPADELEPPATMCTMIGCANALNIELTGAWPTLQRVTVRALDGTDMERVIDCTQQACDQIMLPEFVSERVSVIVEYEGGTREQDHDVEVVTSQPNGPDCPPVCETGHVAMAF